MRMTLVPKELRKNTNAHISGTKDLQDLHEYILPLVTIISKTNVLNIHHNHRQMLTTGG